MKRKSKKEERGLSILKKRVLTAPVWTPDVLLDVPEIDREHKQLFDITKKMYDLIRDKRKTKFACVEGIKYLKNHTMVHFAHEEEYMRSIDYPGYEMHKRLHDNFKNHILPTSEQILEQEDYSNESVESFLGSCIGWLCTHTTVEDLAITGKIESYSNPDFNLDLASFIIQELTHVTKQLANLELNLMNMHYTGEALVKPVHYHIVYSDDKGTQWFVQTSIEAKLVLYMVNKLFKLPTHRLDAMMMAALKQVVRQIVYHIGVSKKDMNDFYVTEEFVLSDREIGEVFEAHCPQYSMLFHSEQGCLTFCADVWDEQAKARYCQCRQAK